MEESLMRRKRDVLIAKKVAKKYLDTISHREIRMRVFLPPDKKPKLIRLLKGFRDGRLAINGVEKIPDLGIHEGFDSIELWSESKEGLESLKSWCEKLGYEVAGALFMGVDQ